MRNVSLNSKQYKLPSGIKVPTTTPYPSKWTKRNTPGSKFYSSNYFAKSPDQKPKEKALFAIPQSRVQENIVKNYSEQAVSAEKTKQDGLKLDQDLVFETLNKLKSKTKTQRIKTSKSQTNLRLQKRLKRQSQQTLQSHSVE